MVRGSGGHRGPQEVRLELHLQQTLTQVEEQTQLSMNCEFFKMSSYYPNVVRPLLEGMAGLAFRLQPDMKNCMF